MSSVPPPHDAAADDGARAPVPWDLSVVVAHLDVSDAEDVLRSLSGRLLDAGAVDLDFPEALRIREQQYPTGLPTPIPTAIPHADPEHVLTPGLAIASLARPVPFGEMGGSGGTVDVRLVVMPLLTDARAHLTALQRLMGLLRDRSAVEDLLAAADDDELAERASSRLAGGTVDPGPTTNGTESNGTESNGTESNGTEMDGTEMDGTEGESA